MTSAIPQPPGVPLLGNVFDVDPKNTWGSLGKLAEKYGEIFKINALGHQIVFVGSAAIAEEICDETRFRKCVTGPVVEIRAAVHSSLFTAYDKEPTWGEAHRIMSPLVSRSSTEAMFDSMRDSVNAIVTKWSSSPSQKVDVTADLKRQSLQSVISAFFNQEENFLDGPTPTMIAAMDAATLEAMKRPNRPKLLTKLLHQRKFDKDIKAMRSFCAGIVAKRRALEETGTPEEDMLHALLHGKDPQTGSSLNEEKIIDEIINIFIGAATCPCLISFAVYFLVQNPEVVTKARQEIDSVLGSDGELQLSDLSRLPYCEAVLRESMRLSNVAPGFNIEPIPSDTPGEITLAGGKYTIPNDQAMIIVLSAVNRDKEVFDEPDAMKPERMMGEAYDQLPAGVKKGFGNGKRECFGKNAAWQWSFITLVSILRKVDLEMADKGYELKTNGAFCLEPLQFFALAGPRGSEGS